MIPKLNSNHKKEFKDKGFFVVEDVLDSSEAKEVRTEVMKLAKWEIDCKAAHFYDSTKTSQRVWNLLNKGSVFREIIQMPLILDIMEWIFDRDTPHQKYYLSSIQANILYPGAPALKLHVDTPVPEPLPDWVIKANTIWVLDEFTNKNGSTECLAGSHKFRFKPTKSDLYRKDIPPITAPLGSVIITHGALWHRGGSNLSSTERIAMLGCFAASYAREIANEENYSAVLDPSIEKNASDNLKAILGLDHGIMPGAKNPAPKS